MDTEFFAHLGFTNIVDAKFAVVGDARAWEWGTGIVTWHTHHEGAFKMCKFLNEKGCNVRVETKKQALSFKGTHPDVRFGDEQ